MTEQEVRDIILFHYPKAKFIAISHTDDFMDIEAKISKGFHYVSLYDECVESRKIETADNVIIADNTYMASFAYNIVLSWIYESAKDNIDQSKINSLLKYQFKKFYGEQVYHNLNNVFSRGILLETLLYEQQIMIPVFTERDMNAEWSKTTSIIGHMMTQIVMFHEMGHYYIDYSLETYNEFIRENEVVLLPFLNAIEQINPALLEEVKCDVMALYSLFMSNKPETTDKLTILRAVVIGFASLAVLYALKASAKETSEEQENATDNVVLNSIETSTQEYYYCFSLDNNTKNMIERAGFMTRLCESIAANDKLDLYSNTGLLSLPNNVLQMLLGYVDHIMDQDDINQRTMARLVSEAFHNCPEGMEYLYLKSKVFMSERKLNLDT